MRIYKLLELDMKIGLISDTHTPGDGQGVLSVVDSKASRGRIVLD